MEFLVAIFAPIVASYRWVWDALTMHTLVGAIIVAAVLVLVVVGVATKLPTRIWTAVRAGNLRPTPRTKEQR